MLSGVILFLVGGVFWLLGKNHIDIGKLPGDLHFKVGDIQVYIPLATSILLSIVLTLLVWLWRWFNK